jgi:hypothetical protein
MKYTECEAEVRILHYVVKCLKCYFGFKTELKFVVDDVSWKGEVHARVNTVSVSLLCTFTFLMLLFYQNTSCH